MSQNIIDLRKTPELPPPHNTPTPATLPKGITPLISWNTLEYENPRQTNKLNLLTGGVTLLLIIIGIITQNYFFIVFIVLAFLVIIMYGRREPHEFSFALCEEGVYIGKTYYGWKALKSFWIFENKDRKELSLETETILNPYLRIPAKNQNTGEIRELIKRFIPEKEHEKNLTDEIAERLGF